MAGVALHVALALWAGAESDVRVRASLGVELDTNARRAVEGRPLQIAGIDELVVSDGLTRAFVDASGHLRFGPGTLARLGATLGTKRFFSASTEDLVAHGLRLDIAHRDEAGWRIRAFGRGRVSRIRDGSRDYDLASGGVSFALTPGPFDLGVRAHLAGFGFLPEDNYDHIEPSAAVEAGWSPWPSTRIGAAMGRGWRFYRGNGLVIAQPLPDADPSVGPKLSFCEDPEVERAEGRDCASGTRRDEDWILDLGVTYRGALVARLGYGFRSQRSSSPVENVDRHQLFASAVVALPWALDLGLDLRLQFSDGAALSADLQLAEADEDQNVVQAKLLRPLGDNVDLELRYSFFASQFGTAEAAEFTRHTAFVGLAIHTSRR